MISQPWRSACLIESQERACTATRLPRNLVSRTAIATSSSLIQLVFASDLGVRLSPEWLSLIESTPYFRNIHTTRRISSWQLTWWPKLNQLYGHTVNSHPPCAPPTTHYS